jgi:hypothetical protein
MSAVAQLVGLIGSGKGAKFASLTYKTESTGEVAKHTLILGASTEVLYKKDIAKLEEMLAGELTVPYRLAAEQLLASRKESLEKGIGNNSKYVHSKENADTYVQADGIPGVKLHKETGVVYVMALSEDKVVLVEATNPKPPTQHKTEQTAAKAKIEYMIPSGRLRQFTLKKVGRAALNGEVLLLSNILED